MKKLILIIIVALLPISIFASPFGLKMGMTYSEVTAACSGNRPERLENDDRYIILPEKKHPTFKYYLAWINDEHGLYRIRGISDEISTDKYGKEAQNAFYSFEHRVEAIYGKPELTDELIDRSNLYQGDDEWSYSLREGARELSAVWAENIKGAKMKDDVSYVSLYVSPAKQYGYSFCLIIDYEFSNADDVENKEDEVL